MYAREQENSYSGQPACRTSRRASRSKPILLSLPRTVCTRLSDRACARVKIQSPEFVWPVPVRHTDPENHPGGSRKITVDDGTIGKIKRDNQAEVTTACGAAVGAFKALMKEKSADPALESDYFDAQINYIVAKLRSRIGEAADAPDVQAFVAYQMYDLVRQLFVEELTTTGGFFDYGEEVTVIGGIQINRANGGDCFMPLMMQSRTKEDGSVVDLFQETFGAPPETKLREVLAGSKINLYDYKLEKGAAAAGSGKVNLK